MGFLSGGQQGLLQTAWTCGERQTAEDQARRPRYLLQGFCSLPRSLAGGPRPLPRGTGPEGWRQQMGLGTVFPTRTPPGLHRHPGPQGGSASAPRPGHMGTQRQPRRLEGQGTPLEVWPLAGTGGPEPHRGQCSASSPRADSGRPGQGESLLRRPSEVVVSQAGRLSGERLTSCRTDPGQGSGPGCGPEEELRTCRNPPAARPLTGCHRGRAGSARRGRWSRHSGR